MRHSIYLDDEAEMLLAAFAKEDEPVSKTIRRALKAALPKEALEAIAKEIAAKAEREFLEYE